MDPAWKSDTKPPGGDYGLTAAAQMARPLGLVFGLIPNRTNLQSRPFSSSPFPFLTFSPFCLLAPFFPLFFYILVGSLVVASGYDTLHVPNPLGLCGQTEHWTLFFFI